MDPVFKNSLAPQGSKSQNNQSEVLKVREVTGGTFKSNHLSREELKTHRLHLTYSDLSTHLKRKESSDWLLSIG